MKIVNQLKNPTVEFKNLKVGDVFMILTGDIFVKISGKTTASWESGNAFSFTSNGCLNLDENKETIPVDVELHLLKNSYESYAK